MLVEGMMTMFARPAAAIGLWAALTLGIATAASAQEAPAPTESTMVVLFERAEEAGALDPREVLGGSVTAYADGVECARLDFDGPEGWLVLGGDGQPQACGTEGTTITFVNGAEQELSEKLLFEAGATVHFVNLAPVPPDSGTAVPAPPGAGSAGLAAPVDGGGVPESHALLGAVGVLIALGGGWAVRRRIVPPDG